MPGAASHPAQAATADKPAVKENGDGGSIIANNIIADFGRGHSHWIWGDDGTPIRFDNGQMPDDPPLNDVVVQGNMVYDSGRDDAPVEGPRYRYAVRISKEVKGLRTPMLVVFGEHDSEDEGDLVQRNFLKTYPNALIESCKNAGHFPMQETPIYLASLIEKFLDAHTCPAPIRNYKKGN